MDKSEIDSIYQWLHLKPPAKNTITPELLAALTAIKADDERLLALVREHEEQQGYRFSGPVEHKVAAVIKHYQRVAADNILHSKSFRDECVRWLRAISIVVDMAANGGTHHEKGARLRGLSEVVESAIRKLDDLTFDFKYSHWDHVDVFESDTPTRELMRRIHDLEAELAQYRKVETVDQPATRTF